MLALSEERIDDALRLLSANLPIIVELDEAFSVSVNLVRIAAALALAGCLVPSATVLAHALAALDEVGYRPQWVNGIADEAMQVIAPALDARALEDAQTAGREMTREDAVALASTALADAIG